jgi:hypothetical protein
MKTEFSRQIFEKYSNFINFVQWEPSCSDEQTDRHDEGNSRFSKFFESAQNNQISKFMEIHPVGAELFRANRRTDRQEEGNSRLLQNCERRLRNCLSQTKRH